MKDDEREMLIRVDQSIADMRPGFDMLMVHPQKCARNFVSYKVFGLIIAVIGSLIAVVKFIIPAKAIAAILALL
jgi:hypothetical protein